ncbi:HesB/YadR/YfhF family protein [Bacillus sp. FJAT-47783]|uniref:HesB/YadR/YfhF family protein n=1 Tax=Bacillus sp. FJAT-47783 TaxID=2922712 RepID=UPI001FABE52E|nr:HesB/YadR/YfhF family protein [Bacillus sp. FJAT-47783]
MKMDVTKEAAKWYKEEFNLTDGDTLRFFARYGGCSNVQKGFSLGVAKEQPMDVGTKISQEGITFFIEEKDLWYFDGKDLTVAFDQAMNEPIFQID